MIRAWAMAAICSLVVGGCTSGESADAGAATGNKPLTAITYINPLPRDPVWDLIGRCMRMEAEKHGIDLHEVGPLGGDLDVQGIAQLLSQAVAVHADAIAVWPGPTAPFDDLFAKQRASGGVIAALGDGTKNQNFMVYITVETQVRSLAAAAARQPGRHRIGAILQAPSDGKVGPTEALTEEVERHPNLDLVAVRYNQGTFTDDLSITKAMLTRHPEIDTVISYSGYPGVYTAIKELRRVGQVRVYSSGNFHEAMRGYIADGLVGGIWVENRCDTGRLAVTGILRAWEGKPVQAIYQPGHKVVSPKEFLRLSDDWV